MIHDDFNFNFDASDFPVSIEEFAAYMDGNLSDDEMQRVSSVIEHDDTMQDVMDSMEQSELTLSEYTPDDLQLPEEITGGGFEMPEIADPSAVDDNNHFFHPFTQVAACAAAPISFGCFDDTIDILDKQKILDKYKIEKIEDLDRIVCASHIKNMDESTNDSQNINYSNEADTNSPNDAAQYENGSMDDELID